MRPNKKDKTFSLRNYLTIILPFIGLMIVPLGCAHRPQVKAPLFPKFTEAELGTVAVVSACFEPEFYCPHKPLTKGKAAGAGALGGFFGSILGGAYTGNPLGLALGIAISPAVAAGGAIYGALEGETKKTIGRAEDTLNHCLSAFRAQEVMQERILSWIRERARYTFVEPEQCGPNALDEEIRYGSFKEKGIDTVLEVSVRKFGLWRQKDAIDPPLSFFMTVSIRLIRIKDDAVLFSHTFRYESKEKQKLTNWAKNDGQLFKEELDRCFKDLAERIVVELFIT
jgi:hypothetical protein